MIDAVQPWFGEQYYLYMWIPGTVLGVVAGITGGLAGALAPRGKARALVTGLFVALIGISAGLLLAGLVALLQGQPYGVWYGFGLPGVIGLVVLGINFPVIRKVYANAELRRLESRDV